MKQKIVGILVCMLVIATAVPAVTSVNFYVTTPVVSSLSNQQWKSENWTETQKLLAPDGIGDDMFGIVALEGDTALIGAPNDNFKGSVYFFTRVGTTWTQQAKFFASDGHVADYFGFCVSLEGDTALIGAYGDDDNGADSGSAYVFVRTGNNWTQQAKLLASDGAAGDYFGAQGVWLSGDTALIGAYGDDDNGADSGSAYVFTRTGTTWTQQAKLLASDGAAGDYFGRVVSLDGNTAIIGAMLDDGAKGSAYVYTRTDTTWAFQQKLIAYDGVAGDQYGSSVSVDGDTAVIGAAGDDDNGDISGSAYVYIRTGTTWTDQQKLTASDGQAGDCFSYPLTLDGDRILLGAYLDDDNGADSGSAYVFTRTGPIWLQEAKLLASDGAALDWFGVRVALDGDTVFIGAIYDDDNGANSGSAYVFMKESENQPPAADFTWTPQNPSINQTITFDASASQDPDGTITQYEWDWDNDGTYDETQSTPTATHEWTNPGSYPVTLRVTDNDTATATSTKTVKVGGFNLEIDIQGGIGVKVEIKNNGTTDANDVSWQIHVEGGILRLINKTVNGAIDIPAGDSVTVTTGLLLGFGSISIIANVAGEEQTAEGTQLIIFSMVK